MSKNMELFNRGAALILAKLYDEFPNSIHLNIRELDDSMTEEEGKVYGSTLFFLRDEEFIRCGKSLNSGQMTSNVVLSSKGLEVLNSIPESISGNISLGEKVKDVAISGTKETLATVIQAVIGAAVSAGI